MRIAGKNSTNPLIHAMYDKKAMCAPKDDADREGSMEFSRTKSTMQTKLLEQLAEENYDQVQKRVTALQSKLEYVNDKIKRTELEVEVNVNNARTASIRHTIPTHHQRDISPALSTFNWSPGKGTTHQESYDWKSKPGVGGSVYTSQWGEMSKYGDDPAVIMMVLKNKEAHEAFRKKHSKN
jgi:hypothetical protein